jgi:hypothetical protein
MDIKRDLLLNFLSFNFVEEEEEEEEEKRERPLIDFQQHA